MPTALRIAEERRLFYVACTRARRRLVVTAVAGTEGEGDQPSRFLAELGVPVRELPGRPRRPLSLAGPGRRAPQRQRRPGRRARPSASRPPSGWPGSPTPSTADGRPLVPAARPGALVGHAAAQRRGRAGRPRPDEPVHLSGSQLGDVLACPRQWFLARKAQAESSRSTAASFGSVVHVLAEHGARTGVDSGELADHLESVWDQLDFDANWLSAVERVEAESALERFVTWQEARTDLRAARHRGRGSAARWTSAVSGSG